jgi:hypothetical protein
VSRASAHTVLQVYWIFNFIFIVCIIKFYQYLRDSASEPNGYDAVKG